MGNDVGRAFDKARPGYNKPERPGPDGMYPWEHDLLDNLRQNPNSPYERFYARSLRTPKARAEAEQIMDSGIWTNRMPDLFEDKPKKKPAKKKKPKKTAKKPKRKPRKKLAKKHDDPSRWEMMAR